MRRSLFLAVLVLAVALASGGAHAKTYNSPYINGYVTTEDPNDWEPDELGVVDPADDYRWGSSGADMVDLYVTWDADSLYIGVTTVNQASGDGNGYLLFIDTDAQNGITGATDFGGANFYPRRITFSTMGADVIMGGWNLPGVFDIKHCSDPTATTDVDEAYSQANPGWRHFEARFSWNGLFGLGQGVVPPGTTLRFIGAIVGGDNSGAYDAMPSSSTGVEANNATPWDAYTDLDNYYETPIDANGDGVPDEGFPPGGSISGTVTLDDTNDLTTVVTVTAYDGATAVKSGQTAPGGGDYTIYLVPDGTYDVVATAPSYLAETIEDVVLAGEPELEGVDFSLVKVTGRIDGQVALSGGPAEDVTVTAYNLATGESGGDGSYTVTGGTGAFSIGTVLDGDWLVKAVAKGYVPAMSETTTIANGDTVDVGLLTSPAVMATKYSFVDSTGVTVYGVSTTVSLPADSIYYYADAWLEPRDAADRIAYWDYDAQDSVALSVTKLDPAYPAAGAVVIADTADVAIPGWLVTTEMFVNGRAGIKVADDEIEILRLAAARGGSYGVLEVGIGAARPTLLALMAEEYAITAGDSGTAISGQLKDGSGNDAKVADVSASMTALGAGGGFSVTNVTTDPNGRFSSVFTSTTAGTTYVTVTVDPASAYATIEVDTLEIVVSPDVAAMVELSATPVALRTGETATLTAAVVDDYGNAVPAIGVSVALSATPSSLVTSLDSPIVTDATGVATGEISAGTLYGTIQISGTAGALPVETIYLPIDATIVEIDETAPESDPDHNSDAGVDLTILRVTNDADELTVTLNFSSNWDGVHIATLYETNGDANGGLIDPFGFPINYGHADAPDYCFTYKYAADDYSDLRRHTGSEWEHYDFDLEEWRIGHADGVNGVTQGRTTKTDSEVYFRVPLSVIGASPGDTVRLQVYLMQETDGQKRTALDSVPNDATHDMLPDVGEWWETATTPVTLGNYTTYVVREEGDAPALANGLAVPAPAAPGDLVVYTVQATDTGGGIGDVFLNLSPLGGTEIVRMLDDGAGADATAGDGIYSASETLTTGASDGDQTVTVTARDATNVWPSTLGITVTVNNPAVAIREFDDLEGDDHGPNQTSNGQPSGTPVTGLYYHYPTDTVFFEGSFDITGVEIFADGDWLVFRTTIGDLVGHMQDGAADWGAPQPSQQTCTGEYRTDMNLQKVDIYIDAREGAGSTSGFPNRNVDVATVDAWDYGISVEGWGKWFVMSNDSSSSANWGLFKNDSDIALCNNYQDDTIDVRIRRDLFGEDGDTDDDIRNWDIIVCLSSHDSDSNDQNLGGIRWINANTGQWQFGGGADSEGGRDRDANVIDVAVSYGTGHEPGRSQEEMLDYTTTDAMDRFDSNMIACVLEASFAEDFSPPIITPFVPPGTLQHVPWVALNEAPAVFWTTITDVSGVEQARFAWRSLGDITEHRVTMVNLRDDIWAADVSRASVVAATNEVSLNVTGQARVISATIRAVDRSSNENEITAGPFELAVPEPWPMEQSIVVADTMALGEEGYDLIFQDGTVVTLTDGDLPSRSDVSIVLRPLAPSEIDQSSIRDDMDYVGTAREVSLESAGGAVAAAAPMGVSLHYPQYDVGSLEEAKFGLFEWNVITDRWILAGAANSPRGNVVGVETDRLGELGVFFWDALGFDEDAGLSGVLTEPNPFSPNGDGLYDEMIVTFYLGREADHVNIEFYDLAGKLARRLVWHQPTDYVGRTPVQIDWDGTDMHGNVVPYGIYVMRVEAKFKQQPTYERINRPVVVIK